MSTWIWIVKINSIILKHCEFTTASLQQLGVLLTKSYKPNFTLAHYKSCSCNILPDPTIFRLRDTTIFSSRMTFLRLHDGKVCYLHQIIRTNTWTIWILIFMCYASSFFWKKCIEKTTWIIKLHLFLFTIINYPHHKRLR